MMSPESRLGFYFGTHPAEAEAFGLGGINGFINTINPVNWVKGIWNTVAHPVKTISGIGDSVTNTLNTIKNGSSVEQFGLLGNFIGAEIGGIAVGELTSIPINKLKTHVPQLKNGKTVYRVYGEDSGPYGASWTTKNPLKVKNYRDKAGLPSGLESNARNSGQFVIEGVVIDSDKCVLQRKALPLDGTTGGINEYIIPNAIENGAIQIKNVSGANPPF